MERVWCIFNVINASGLSSARVHHTMHEHASPPRLDAPHGMQLVLLLCFTTIGDGRCPLADVRIQGRGRRRRR